MKYPRKDVTALSTKYFSLKSQDWNRKDIIFSLRGKLSSFLLNTFHVSWTCHVFDFFFWTLLRFLFKWVASGELATSDVTRIRKTFFFFFFFSSFSFSFFSTLQITFFQIPSSVFATTIESKLFQRFFFCFSSTSVVQSKHGRRYF